jgi:hypothetical protein
VPLQRNQEYRLSLPYNDTIEANLHQQQQQQQHQQQQHDLSLPSDWIMEMTEDCTDCYYYNKLTGEMRTTPPSHSERFNNTQPQQRENGSGDSRHGHSDDDDDDDDDSVFSAHDNNDFDFQSVAGQLDAVKINAAGCGYDSNDEDLFPGNDDDDDTSERVKYMWNDKKRSVGSKYRVIHTWFSLIPSSFLLLYLASFSLGEAHQSPGPGLLLQSPNTGYNLACEEY